MAAAAIGVVAEAEASSWGGFRWYESSSIGSLIFSKRVWLFVMLLAMSGGAGSEEQFGTVWKNPSSALSGMELGSKQAVSSYIIEPDFHLCLLELNGSLSFLHHLKETNIKKGNHWSTRLWKKPCKF